MKKSVVAVAGALLLTSALAHADQVVEASEDLMVGGGFGGLTGFMVGGAVGGPIGAIVGGSLGFFSGQQVQQIAGLDQTLYVIQAENGTLSRVRTSATDTFVVGEAVDRDGAKLSAMNH